ncbi:HAD-IIIC family phosphatase [Streptomyces clavuligerus]|nr:HAD-IIIC family phosphatase [Streptomyces clavuligerus]ANW21348.1 methoxymalonyl-ACP biosynthesis protein FkbH [Streptomyces clavuligerus]AXU15974.1 HAD-IIIC family phosphatase [Streptomyces clavuligerus]MBY6306108.1 HAD-IIIC family phosphatase [Streptomyces clavuligerus]QCS08754.1 methoxymalonyl-ACP biosynthesis protein FkbH [Streptomyces clavuligerus]QPJ91908.1 HAD-IIIC family phosphatase [Streptomyces clavuligerus]
MATVASTTVGERTGPLDRLRALHREGRLVAAYPEVPGLLAELAAAGDPAGPPAPDLVRAGQLLARLDPAAVRAAHPAVDTFAAVVTGHSTLGGLTAPLTAELARHGMLLRLRPGDFGSWFRDLQDTGSELYTARADAVLCVLDAQIVFDELPHPWLVEDLERIAAAKLALIGSLAERYVAHGTGTLVLNTLPLLRGHTRRLVDARSRARLGVVWREFNAGLLRLSAAHDRVHVVDLDPLVACGPPVQDPRLAAYAKVLLGDELLAGYAREVGHLARGLRGRTRKVLVVDLDNTLWDGILGDDGPEGIAAATTYRGEAFGRFQKAVGQIGAQGVLLAVCSKNDREPVLGVLRDHPDMVLREQDFVRVNANWEPKDGNLLDIARRLNLGVDSLVFADDSPFECGLVAGSLPGVAVIRLDEEPALHVERLLADGWFDVPELTAEDRARAAQYRTDAARQDLQESAGSMEEYLAGLGVEVSFSPVREHEIARVSQVTLRTNQFNLTTERLQQAEVRALLGSPDHRVLAIRSRDRFGDNGLVGAVFVDTAREGGGWHIDNMLLSCRVFARGIEQSCLAAVVRAARDAGAGAVYARYRPTAKNHKVRGLYPSAGFAELAEDGAGAVTFRHDLADETLPVVPGHVRLTADLAGTLS